MRRLISPLPNDYQSLFSLLHTHLHTDTNGSSSIFTGYKQVGVRDTWKGKASHFRTFITHFIWYLHLQCMETEYNYREKRALCFICPGNETHSHPQWPFLTTVSATDNTQTYLSVFRGEILGQWEPVMNETSLHVWYILIISRTNNTDIWNEYHELKGRGATPLTWQAGGNWQFVHKKTLALIYYLSVSTHKLEPTLTFSQIPSFQLKKPH